MFYIRVFFLATVLFFVLEEHLVTGDVVFQVATLRRCSNC